MPGQPREAIAKGETWPLKWLVVGKNHEFKQAESDRQAHKN
jgi:hypothetical protein